VSGARAFRGAATALAAAALAAAVAGPRLTDAQPAPAWPAVDAARGAALLSRVVGARDGTVRLTFTLRPGVCGSGGSIRTRAGTRTYYGDGNVFSTTSRSRDVEWDDDCTPGPGRLALDVSAGQVTDVRVYVGGRWRPRTDRAVTDLGAASAPEVAGMLLALAERGEGKGARGAIFPATLVDSVTLWPTLLRVARDTRRPKETRGQAMHWLAYEAGDVAARGLTELTDDPEREVRVQAVFALSRRPADEAVPALVRVARTHRDPEMRRQALFWLGRIEDPRVLALFEELLVK
jgi:hypothetical protein